MAWHGMAWKITIVLVLASKLKYSFGTDLNLLNISPKMSFRCNQKMFLPLSESQIVSLDFLIEDFSLVIWIEFFRGIVPPG